MTSASSSSSREPARRGRAHRARGSCRYSARARSGRSRCDASLSTDSSSSPSTRPADARSRPGFPTSSAISCSAAAPRSSRWTRRRAERDRLGVLARGVEDQRREQQPLGMLERASARPRPRGSSPRELADAARRARSAAPGSSRAGAGRLAAAAPTRRARGARARARRSPRGTATPGRCRAAAPRTAVWVASLSQRSGSSPSEPNHSSSRGPGVAPSAIASAASSPIARASRVGGSPARSTTPSSTRSQPPSGIGSPAAELRSSIGLQLLQPPAQQRRRHQRRDEHHEQQRRVEVLAEHVLLEADGGEDQPDLTAREHAQPDQRLVARRADRARPRRAACR